jgi:hypothetical protein
MTFQEHFITCWPEEGVGYIKDDQFFPLENLAENKQLSFKVDPAFLLQQPDVLLHSHTTGHIVLDVDPRSPSYEDLEGQIKTDIEWGICVTDGEVCEDPLYWGNPNRRPDLLEREFIFNLQDCYSLVQDWFFVEHGIELPNGPRTPFWNTEGDDHLTERFEAFGFSRVDVKELERGDVLFYKIRSQVPNHLGVYLGDGQVLSHFYGRVSCVESFGKWANYVDFAARFTQ